GALPLLPLKRATRTIPIVFTQIYDPVGSGFVPSLTRPDGNITGFTLGEFSMGGKILEVLKEIAPRVNRVAVILNLEQPPHVAMWRSIEATAPLFGVRLTPADMQGPAEIEQTIEAFAREPNGGLIVLPGPVSIAHRELITRWRSGIAFRRPTDFGSSLPAVAWCRMASTRPNNPGKRPVTSIVFSRARIRATCRFSSRLS